MRWRELVENVGIAVLCMVAFLVVLAIVGGCASAPHGGTVQQQCQAAPGGAVTCTCTGAP